MMRARILATVLLALSAARGAVACPSCYGAADGPMVDGANMGILFMLGVTGMMLTSIVFFFVMMRRRARRIDDHTPGAAYLNEHGSLQWNNS